MLKRVELDISTLPGDRKNIIPGPEPKLGRLKRKIRNPITGGIREFIPVSEPCLGAKEKAYVNDCLESSWISSTGSYVNCFENSFANFCGVSYGASCSSGTAALHLALKAFGVGQGDEIIVPSFAMIAVANAVVYCGARPILIDVTPDDYNVNPAEIECVISDRTKGIVVVHTYGHPARMTEILSVAEKFGLFVVEDAAEAHGASIDMKKVGGFGHAATFSFYANKTLTTGEGGMVVSSDKDFIATVRTLRDHAFTQERHFWHMFQGYNYRMTNLQAAVGLAQCERATELVESRRQNAAKYTQELKNIPNLRLPRERSGCVSSFWMYAIEVVNGPRITRDTLRMRLANVGVETRAFFIPIHLQPTFYSALGSKVYPVSERLCATGLYLPSASSFSNEDIRYVTDAVLEAVTR